MSSWPYSTSDWKTARKRAIRRDGECCTVGRLFGGDCKGSLHVHHLVPLREDGDLLDLDNLATVCASHHPRWESLRRTLNEQRRPPMRRCRHRHVSAEARQLCEKRLNREKEWALVGT